MSAEEDERKRDMRKEGSARRSVLIVCAYTAVYHDITSTPPSNDVLLCKSC